MKQDYFVHNGNKYYSGTQINIRPYNELGERPQTAAFVDYDTETEEYRFEINGKVYTHSKRYWLSYFLGVKGENPYTNPSKKEWTFRKELDVEGMINAWLWYIVIMAVSTILKGNWMYWIVVSCIFFKYRNGKLRKAGYKS